MNVLSVANRLDRAESLFTILAPILVESFGGKQMQALGRKSVTLPNGSVWEIRAANKNLHGSSNDLICVDEVFDVDMEVLDVALRPSQIARKSPLMSMWSTAGDEGSTAMIALREQALSEIDAGISSQLYFAEWSMPQTFNGTPVDPMDERFWGWANPALGTTITIEGLRSVSKKDSFLRAHLNQWISARGAWLDRGVWEKCLSDDAMPEGGCLSVDTSLSDNRFVGVRAAIVDGITHVKVEFVAETETDMWLEIDRVMATPLTQLLITPTLMLHLPTALQRRTTQVGYAELTKYTSLVRSMIYEKRVAHHGEVLLTEHCARAVLVKTPTGAVLSSQKSPGPIELCRTMVWAVAEVSRPKAANRPMMVIV
jgi:phage terminase large subunit-like protein